MKKAIKILFLVCIIIGFLSIFNIVNAASASISASKISANVGDNVTISVNINAASWNITVSGSGISDSIVGYDADANNVSTKKSYTLNTSSAGTYTVKLSGDVTDGVTDVNSSINQTVTVTVTQPEPPSGGEENGETHTSPPPPPVSVTKSNNANLANLGIEPNDFTGFNPNKTSYEVTVPNKVSQIKIYATAKDSKATVSGIGYKDLTEGKNKAFEIIVTAEDGTQKKYSITVIREVAEGEIIPNTDENVADTTSNEIAVGLGKLEIAGMTLSPEFSTNEYKYTVEGIIDNIKTLSDFKELITAEANFEGASIEVTSGDEEFKVGRNKITITVKDLDDREIAVYNIVLKLKSSDTAAGIVDSGKSEPTVYKNINMDKIIVVSSIAIISIIAIIISVIAYKQRRILVNAGLVGREEDYEEYDWEEKFGETGKVEEETKQKLDEIFSQKNSEFEADEKDFETKRGRSGKRFQ